MLKDVLTAVDLTAWAEAGLVLFAIVFVAISVRTLIGDKTLSARHAALAVEEDGDD
jgi:hypothetical protein